MYVVLEEAILARINYDFRQNSVNILMSVCVCVQCIMELCEEAFIESCFEELFEEEDRFAEELEQFLSSLTQEQVGSLVHQLDAVSLDSSQPPVDQNADTKVFPHGLHASLPSLFVIFIVLHPPINILANFRQLLNLIANISGTKQEIAERKTALQTVISLAHA